MTSKSERMIGIIVAGFAAVTLIYVAVGVWNGNIQVIGSGSEETIDPAVYPEAAAAQAAQRNVENQKKLLEAMLEQNRLIQESINNNR